jgi:hypothetical protein
LVHLPEACGQEKRVWARFWGRGDALDRIGPELFILVMGSVGRLEEDPTALAIVRYLFSILTRRIATMSRRTDIHEPNQEAASEQHECGRKIGKNAKLTL